MKYLYLIGEIAFIILVTIGMIKGVDVMNAVILLTLYGLGYAILDKLDDIKELLLKGSNK